MTSQKPHLIGQFFTVGQGHATFTRRNDFDRVKTEYCDIAISTTDVYETIFPFDADYIVRRSLKPLEKRTLQYTLPPLDDDAEVTVRLRYRNLPPYVLRALQLDELVERLQIFDIDEVTLGTSD